VGAINELSGGVGVGVGVDAMLRCVGTTQAMQTAIDIASAGSMVGFVGVPHGVELPVGQMFRRTLGVHGGGAPVRLYPPELLEDVLAERNRPGPRSGLRGSDCRR
jgi:threonine dehydrogenase-like Zn-dependent dehydrogenase